MSTDVDQALYRRPAWRKSKQRVAKRGLEGSRHKTIRPEDWGGTSEEEKQESESTTEERHEDSLYGQFLNLITKKFSSLVMTFDLLK